MEEKERSFRELLTLLTLVDGVDTTYEITDEEYAKLIGDIADKVDKIRFVVTKFEAEIERLKKIEAEYTKSRRSMENNLTRLKEYVVRQMVDSKLNSVRGERWKISLGERDSISCKEDITDQDYNKLSLDCPNAIKKSYSWSKTALKDYLDDKKTADIISHYIVIESKPYIRWGVNKNE